MKLLKINEILKLLEKKIDESPQNCFFNDCAQTMDIIDFEVDLDIHLPLSYITFLENYNGGFICGNYQSNMIRHHNDFESARWNSTSFFSLEEIRVIYESKSEINWKLFDKKYDVYPFIPFCRTAMGELLIFVNPLDEDTESPVFDAFHEDFPSDWGVLYNNFSELLENYIQNDGNISTTSYKKPSAIEFNELQQNKKK